MEFKELQEYFHKQENIILAFIFGSTAKGMSGEESDLDIALYLKDENDKDQIWLNLGRILYLSTSLDTEDFLEFAKGYHRIFLRSGSLIPEDRIRLLERINFLKSEYQEIESFSGLKYEEYPEDKNKRRNIERWAENIINCTIDIAKIILASEKKKCPKPKNKHY